MRILGRNVRVPRGEIDILAEDGDEIVFVEVRTRRLSDGSAAESVIGAKLRRMWRAAMEWCEATGTDAARARLDVVSVDLRPDGTVVEVVHHRGMEVEEES